MAGWLAGYLQTTPRRIVTAIAVAAGTEFSNYLAASLIGNRKIKSQLVSLKSESYLFEAWIPRDNIKVWLKTGRVNQTDFKLKTTCFCLQKPLSIKFSKYQKCPLPWYKIQVLQLKVWTTTRCFIHSMLTVALEAVTKIPKWFIWFFLSRLGLISGDFLFLKWNQIVVVVSNDIRVVCISLHLEPNLLDPNLTRPLEWDIVFMFLICTFESGLLRAS